MRKLISKMFHSFADIIYKAQFRPPPRSYGGGYIDRYKKRREPNNKDLLSELKSTAWACATLNAAVVADNPPKLYYIQPEDVMTLKSMREKLKNKDIRHRELHKSHPLVVKNKAVGHVVEINEHPVLELFKSVNQYHNSFDMWELTDLYQEIFGEAYWKIEMVDLEGMMIPERIFIVPTQYITPKQNDNRSDEAIDYYEYRSDNTTERYEKDEIIPFLFPNVRDPYRRGMSPMRSAFEAIAMNSEYHSMRAAVFNNTGLPSVIISPGDVIGQEEADRLESQWNSKFREGGQGKALIAESELRVNVLNHSMGDLSALAEIRATKEEIANAFHVPMAFLESSTNLANMEASERLHMKKAIKPRLKRRDEKLNEKLLPMYPENDGLLFFASDDPVPENQEEKRQREATDLRLGIRSINEIRAERNLDPVEWGETPFAQPAAGAQQ